MSDTDRSFNAPRVAADLRESRARDERDFAHDDEVESGATLVVDPLLDPASYSQAHRCRESRDGKLNPITTPISIWMDVTGSLRNLPVIFLSVLIGLFGKLERRKSVPGPQLSFNAIGDPVAESDFPGDQVPVQLAQYENSVPAALQLRSIVREGGGGPGMKEGYIYAFYALARHTVLDSFEKRKRKGIAIFIGDETSHDRVIARIANRIFGDHIRNDILLADIYAEAARMHDIYMIIPAQAAHGSSTVVRGFWNQLLGEDHVFVLNDAQKIDDLIVTIVETNQRQSQGTQQ